VVAVLGVSKGSASTLLVVPHPVQQLMTKNLSKKLSLSSEA
jgi:hypothetical protein